jgi:hypothetical protein
MFKARRRRGAASITEGTAMQKFIVTEKAMRPASRDRKCFYCSKNIGANHLDDCVLVRRDMTIRFSFEIKIPLPAHWEGSSAEFHYNEGSWCSMNIVNMLEEHMEKHQSCLCDIVKAEFVSQDPKEYLEEN